MQKDIAAGKMKPGQYFILKFDFSRIARSPDDKAADRSLKNSINGSFRRFYNTYGEHLGEDANSLINPDEPSQSLEQCVEKVNSAIQKRGNEALAGIQGVSVDCSLTLNLELNSTDLFTC